MGHFQGSGFSFKLLRDLTKPLPWASIAPSQVCCPEARPGVGGGGMAGREGGCAKGLGAWSAQCPTWLEKAALDRACVSGNFCPSDCFGPSAFTSPRISHRRCLWP